MSDPVLERWKAFMEKIRQRMEEVLAEADQGFTDLLQSSPTDTATFGNAMQGIRFRVQGLTSKIGDTWSAQVSDQCSGGNMDTAIAMMEDMQDALDARYERWRAHWESQLYRNMWPLVQAEMQKGVTCNKCGAPLQKQNPTAMETIQQENRFPGTSSTTAFEHESSCGRFTAAWCCRLLLAHDSSPRHEQG